MAVLTLRERIMAELKRRLSEVVAGAPVDDPYTIGFNMVTRGTSLEERHETVETACTILDTDERVIVKIQQVVRILTVLVEFVAFCDPNDDEDAASQKANEVLGMIQRKMKEDLNLTEPDGTPSTSVFDRQLSENVQEVRSQLFLDGYADRKVTGVSAWEITYKTHVSDPRVRVKPGF